MLITEVLLLISPFYKVLIKIYTFFNTHLFSYLLRILLNQANYTYKKKIQTRRGTVQFENTGNNSLAVIIVGRESCKYFSLKSGN